MRIGVRWTRWPEAADRQDAEESGAVLLWADVTDSPTIAAAELAVTTTFPRVVVRVVLGSEHPVTLAEEVAVLDHLSGGRMVAVVDTNKLDAAAAAEDLGLLRTAWSGRPISHHGARWSVPAGLASDAPRRISVTPAPAQVTLPVWLTGSAASQLAAATGLPVLAEDLGSVDSSMSAQPAVVSLRGELDADRDLLTRWRDALATHVLVDLPDHSPPNMLREYVARYLQPEVAMPDFPRLMADAPLPGAWNIA